MHQTTCFKYPLNADFSACTTLQALTWCTVHALVPFNDRPFLLWPHVLNVQEKDIHTTRTLATFVRKTHCVLHECLISAVPAANLPQHTEHARWRLLSFSPGDLHNTIGELLSSAGPRIFCHPDTPCSSANTGPASLGGPARAPPLLGETKVNAQSGTAFAAGITLADDSAACVFPLSFISHKVGAVSFCSFCSKLNHRGTYVCAHLHTRLTALPGLV